MTQTSQNRLKSMKYLYIKVIIIIFITKIASEKIYKKLYIILNFNVNKYPIDIMKGI